MNDTESNDTRDIPADSTDEHTNRVSGGEAAKSKRGRKPAHESRSVEIRQRIAEWKLTPPTKRLPRTLSELARELGIGSSLASYYARQIPDSVDDLLDQIPAIALIRLCPGILDVAHKALMAKIRGPNGARLALQLLEKAGVFDCVRAKIHR